MEIFELEGFEYIELNKLLKIMQVAGSGGEAKLLIDDGMVKVNGLIELQRRKKLRKGDKVELEGIEIEVK